MLLAEHSRKQCDKIVRYIGTDRLRFGELVQLFLQDEYRVVQRAAWPLSRCAERYPALVQKYLPRIVRKLQQPGLHDGVKRNTVRMLQHIDIPLPLHGMVMNTCFDYLADPKEAVAIKAFSMTVLQKLAAQYPDIMPELKALVEDQLPHQTPAFKSRAKKLMQQSEG